MENIQLFVPSKDYELANSVKQILEETGNYMINIECKIPIDRVRETSEYLVNITEKSPYRRTKVSPKKSIVYFSEFVFDMNNRKLQWKDERLTYLSWKESRILMDLVENAGSVVTRKFLLLNYWGEISYYKSRCLDVLISKLRKYLSIDPSVEIVNFRCEGLRLNY